MFIHINLFVWNNVQYDIVPHLFYNSAKRNERITIIY